jgi:primosomal protein N' (replication factor Y) (superfamily II helicase)
MPSSSPFIEVLLPRPFVHPFHYLLPESWEARTEPGMRAVVPFGHELLTGVIVQTGAPPPAAARGRLRHLHQLIDDTPLLPAELLELLRQLADEYFVPWGELLSSVIPSSLLPAGERRYHLAEPAPPQLARSRLSQHVLALLRDHPKGMSSAVLAKQLAATQTTLQPGRPIRLAALLRRLVTSKQIAMTWNIKPLTFNNEPKLCLNKSTYTHNNHINTYASSHFIEKHHQYDIASLTESITHRKHNVFVSVTQEQTPINGRHLYLAVTTAAVHSGHSVLVLSPEISHVEALADWLQSRVACPVVTLHSELTTTNLAQRWLWLQTIPAPVIVIGTRRALFAPLPLPGLIIVDEEADPLYKQEERPRLHARDLALRRAEQAEIPVLLSARAPSVESYWRCREGRYYWLTTKGLTTVGLPPSTAAATPDVHPPHLHSTTTPATEIAPPIDPGVVEVIDLRTAPMADGLLSAPLIDALAERMRRGEQSLLFVNRRGYAHSLICRDCGELVRCSGCRVGLTYYASTTAGATHLRCRRCGAQRPPPTLCPHCTGHRLGPLGTGTQRVQAALHHRWPEARILRVDRDVIIQSDGRSDGEESPDAVEEADLIVGTQRCLHAPAPPRLSLVAVLDAELDLSHPDFRAEERQLQLLFRLQGLMRQTSGSSLALVQSRQPNRPTLQAFKTGRLELLYLEEIAQRRNLGYPPFRRLAALRLSGRQAGNRAVIERLTDAIRARLTDPQRETVELWGPIPATLPRRGGAAAWELLLKAETAAALHRSLQVVSGMPPMDRLLASNALEIEVDPA